MQSLKLLTKIGSPADRLKAERLIQAARDAREDFDAFQQERLQSTSLTHELLVKPILDTLGFVGARCQLLPRAYNSYQLYSNGHPVAALTIDPYRANYQELGPMHERARAVWKTTTCRQRAIFSNGFDWLMCSYDADRRAIMDEPFSLDDPDGFWDLFFLSLEH